MVANSFQKRPWPGVVKLWMRCGPLCVRSLPAFPVERADCRKDLAGTLAISSSYLDERKTLQTCGVSQTTSRIAPMAASTQSHRLARTAQLERAPGRVELACYC